MNNKIIGYKLKSEEYYKAASLIIYNNIEGSMQLSSIVKSIAHIENLQEAGVLDLWFEPVYKKEPEFKVGDYITVTGNIKNGWLEDTKHRAFKITREKTQYSGGFYFGVTGHGYINAGLYSDFRLATEEKILIHLRKEFTERTGIDVGSEIVEYYEGLAHTGIVTDFKIVTRDNKIAQSNLNIRWFRENPNEKYQLVIKDGICSFSPNCKLAKPKLTFGGDEATLEKLSSGVRVKCGGVTGTLSQMERVNHLCTIGKTTKFGSATLHKITFESGYQHHLKDIDETPLELTIGCTTGTWKEFTYILEEARKLNN